MSCLVDKRQKSSDFTRHENPKGMRESKMKVGKLQLLEGGIYLSKVISKSAV